MTTRPTQAKDHYELTPDQWRTAERRYAVSTWDETARRNFAACVHEINSHDDLVAALETIVEAGDMPMGWARGVAIAAIAKAKGEKP